MFLASRPDDMSYRLDAQLFKASSVRTMRIFRPNLPLCREASNCSNLHSSGCFSRTSGRLSVFNKLQDFFPKHSYRKIAATVRTRSSIRQVLHLKSRRPDASQHGPDTRASNMEIACITSTVRTTIPLVRMCEALVWKLLVTEVRSSGRQDTTVRTRLKT
jgi:hypothetical protein